MCDCSLKEKKRGKKKWVKGLDNSGNIEGFFQRMRQKVFPVPRRKIMRDNVSIHRGDRDAGSPGSAIILA